MNLNTYIQKYSNRKDFAEKIKTSVFYLNNLCQHPNKAGKKMIEKIEQATNGKVKFSDMVSK
jgi:pantothenate kinase